jgi:hypothetical protein
MQEIISSLDFEYCRASQTKRFANYIIDKLLINSILSGGITFAIIDNFKITVWDKLSVQLITLLAYAVLMGIIEGVFKGKSLGKLITRTRAINTDGTDINFQKAILRNIIRAVPFNALSAVSSPCIPWHDQWSNTMVVDEKLVQFQEERETFFEDLKNQSS